MCGLVLLTCGIHARANIGDSLTDLRARYGSAKDMDGQMLFEVRLRDGQIAPARGASDVENHLTITVYFDGGKSGMEIFTRNTSDPQKDNMSQDDINTILNAASDGLQWTPLAVSNGKPTWIRSDKRIIAKLNPKQSDSPDDASVLIIMVNDSHK